MSAAKRRKPAPSAQEAIGELPERGVITAHSRRAPGEPGPPPPALDWGDVAAVKVWARDVCIQARDGIGAGLDATAPPGQRQLGRAKAREILEAAGGKVAAAIKVADLDLGEGAR